MYTEFFSLNGQNFEINKILSDNYILNIVSNEKGVYIGTSDGIFVIDETYNLKLFNAKIAIFHNSKYCK